MTKPKVTDQRLIKNDGDFHAAETDLNHHLNPTSMAALPDRDAESDASVGLRELSTTDLRDRARALVIAGWSDMERERLIEALARYKRTNVDAMRPRA